VAGSAGPNEGGVKAREGGPRWWEGGTKRPRGARSLRAPSVFLTLSPSGRCSRPSSEDRAGESGEASRRSCVSSPKKSIATPAGRRRERQRGRMGGRRGGRARRRQNPRHPSAARESWLAARELNGAEEEDGRRKGRTTGERWGRGGPRSVSRSVGRSVGRSGQRARRRRRAGREGLGERRREEAEVSSRPGVAPRGGSLERIGGDQKSGSVSSRPMRPTALVISAEEGADWLRGRLSSGAARSGSAARWDCCCCWWRWWWCWGCW